MTRLLNILCPIPSGYVPYLRQVKIDLRRAYLRGAILGLFVGVLIGLVAGLYWADKQDREHEIVFRELSQRAKLLSGKPTALRDALGDEIGRRTALELKMKKAGVK